MNPNQDFFLLYNTVWGKKLEDVVENVVCHSVSILPLWLDSRTPILLREGMYLPKLTFSSLPYSKMWTCD